MLEAVVLAHLTAGVGQVVAAPLDALAGDLKDRVSRRLRAIGDNAEAKADGRPIEAPDRVLVKALTEGGFVDDEIAVDYLGGVLAASDASDEAAPIIAQIGRLSAAQLRLHFIIYREVRRLCIGRDIAFYDFSRDQAEVRVTADELCAATTLDWNGVGRGLAGLVREGLVTTYAMAASTSLVTVTPSGLGVELFLWGNGVQIIDSRRLLDPALDLRFAATVGETPSAVLTRETGPENAE